MRNIILVGLFVFGLTVQSFGQKEEKLPEVVIMDTNYKYLNEVGSEEAAVPVELLHKKVASYNVKNSDVYKEGNNSYEVSFRIPDGKILAAYDKDGKLLRTIERFKGVRLPVAVMKSIYGRFPGWKISDDVYLVSYHKDNKVTEKYKIKLENGDKLIKVKTDSDGNFL
ncbi:nicotinate-nucleotide adenylyltransferase [Aquimarina rubra]|uniref:Nicotinate-nucleotide adenylyltransferase n=1 Tax=Aquimarina rubra TaxID=1920033 RepID=A0ABW5LD25_9FLAO